MFDIKSDPATKDSDGDGLDDEEDPYPIVYNEIGYYDGNKAIEYATKWYDSYNFPNFYQYREDCTNFISQCINYGGVEMNGTGETNGWHSYNLNLDIWYNLINNNKYDNILKYVGSFIKDNIFTDSSEQYPNQIPEKHLFDWDVSESWRKVKDNLEFFSCKNYSANYFTISNLNNLEHQIKTYNIEKGDLMYLEWHGSNGPHHATIISKVDKNMIYYAGHTGSQIRKPISEFFKEYTDAKIHILKIRNWYIK